jgi:hypothetical protein
MVSEKALTSWRVLPSLRGLPKRMTVFMAQASLRENEWHSIIRLALPGVKLIRLGASIGLAVDK